jgi:hypothetical protein
MSITARTLVTILPTVFITKQIYVKYQSESKTLRLQSPSILVAIHNDCNTSQTTVIFVFNAVNKNIRILKTAITHLGSYEQSVQQRYTGFTKRLLAANCSSFTLLIA